jgi:DNA helicase-2/ATP-dependent DNA helicase PcrA
MTTDDSDPFDLAAFPERRTDRPKEPQYLTALNDEQRSAVEALDGPVLVLAGAGTGKTRVLTTRLAHILATKRAWPGQVLAVTFTNKAAREMKDRIGHLIGGVVEGMPWLGTFHSIGARILRRHAELVDLKPNFTILDTDDQIRLIKQLLSAEGIDEKRWPARAFSALTDRWKNRGLTPQKLPESEGGYFADGKGVELYRQYQDRLKTLNAADFGDLILECLRLLQENKNVLEDYQRRFVYMMVDEYQDTNVAQYLWLRLLARKNQNICCVGDDDQSIYGWRGAEVSNILRFEKDFPGATVVRLERNYRSTAPILGAASGLISSNEGRLGKTLWTDQNEGEPVSIKGYWDGEEEARSVGEEIEAIQRNGVNLSQVAILVRAGFQMREFEDRFITLGMPYRVVGGPRFYERAEIRDALAYLRIVHSSDHDLAFERIINQPKRGIGAASVQKINQFARFENLPLLTAAKRLSETDELPKRARNSLVGLTADIARWSAAAAGIPHPELAEMVLDESGYTEMWQNDKSADAPGRLENLKEFVRSMEQFENLAAFLEHVSLVMEVEQNNTEDRVNLMTLHAAKGLEFECVFLPGWEEGLFPHQRSLDESGNAGLEEERRLAYVGITRAKKRAFISFAANRRIHALWQSSIPSRFIDELPQEHVETDSTQGVFSSQSTSVGLHDTNFGSDYSSPGWLRAKAASEAGFRGASPPLLEQTPDLVAITDPDVVSFDMGERIFHQKFGYGLIVEIDGNKLTVEFEKAGRKKVIDSFLERH